MRWLIRWTDFRTFRDYETIIDADSREAAEAVARERRITLTYLEPVDGDENIDAKSLGVRLSWSLSFLGKPLRTPQVVALLLCALATVGVLLQAVGVLRHHIWMPH